MKTHARSSRRITLTLGITLGIALLAGLSLPMSVAAAAPTSTPQAYPLDTCIVSGDALDGDAISENYAGREVRFCSKSCVNDFEADQASYLQVLDQAVIQAQLADYPLKTCVVSGEALGGDMGDAVDHVVGNRLVRFCCQSCEKDLAASPAKYLAKLDAAVVEAQLVSYPADTCPVSGQKLGGMGEPYNFVHAGQLVRFCCSGCIGKFNEDPQAAVASIYGVKSAAPPAKQDPAKQDPSAHDHSAHDHSAHSH